MTWGPENRLGAPIPSGQSALGSESPRSGLCVGAGAGLQRAWKG